MLTTTKSKRTLKAKRKATPDADRKALVDSLFGSLSMMKYSVNEYLREKQAEIDAENAN